MNTPMFLKVDAKTEDAVTDSELSQLEELVKAYKLCANEIEDIQATLKLKQEFFDRLSRELIPEILNKHGFSELRLRSGDKVIVKEEISASVPDDKKPAFFEFLKSRNEEDIIKLQMQFKKMPAEMQQQLFDFLNGYNYDYEAERGVHPQTLKKYLKELLGVGDEERAQGIAKGKYLRFEDVSDVVNVFTYFNTKIK